MDRVCKREGERERERREGERERERRRKRKREKERDKHHLTNSRQLVLRLWLGMLGAQSTHTHTAADGAARPPCP